ncbi:putative HTH-type transcriptional regulator YvdT [Clostridium liquoris]|jgi:AcrR family transcriptional regulator|uniref:Putative HTH-type transcriptional regulator YvdT n=1 Tax=Clostridium liquoris TaxID=1289519 RepID=A0A2T0B6C1_9CLOT|nr:TetR/AcrR family transcriptional regulator [Clostridium liquoris]PRR79412.1 putative HTH-type transcriptional regulator YvdT [Clostridium liquoris]
MSNDKDENKPINKKVIKEKNLYDSAFELFSNKGINGTSIDDIVKKAGVAKGTFYLYFKNKYDIIDKIILKKSASVLKEAVEVTLSKNLQDFSQSIIFFIDYIIEYLRGNTKLLKIIHKNLSWGLYRKAIASANQYEDMRIINELLEEIRQKENIDEEEFEINLFMVIELTSSICYSSIILQEPYDIDTMKPYLFNMIKKITG